MIAIDIKNQLEQFYTILTGFSKIRVEWSLKVHSDHIEERDRITFWISPNKENSELIALLEILNIPLEVEKVFVELIETSINIGISISQKNIQCTKCLYIHYKKHGQNCYVAYKWKDKNEYDISTYSFSYFPCTPEGIFPESQITTVLKPLFLSISNQKHLQEMSGFWLRNYQNQIDQVDLIFTWTPKLASILKEIELSGFCNSKTIKELSKYQNLSFRHIAFSKSESMTLYFSALVSSEFLKEDFKTLQQQIDLKSKNTNQLVETLYFDKIPQMEPLKKADNWIGKFYDSNNLKPWKKVLGLQMHYHFGMFNSKNKEQDPFNTAISELYKFIPMGSSIYDVGCGWGGPAEQLTRENDCKTLSITISKTQYLYCYNRGLEVRLGNAETTLPPYPVDTILFMESFEHIVDKLKLLRTLRPFGKQLVMRVHCQDNTPNSINFGNTMHMINSNQLKELIEQAGWNITHWKNRRMESNKSINIWHERFQQIPKTNDFHLETFRQFCSRVMSNKKEWAKSNPLIEVVAN